MERGGNIPPLFYFYPGFSTAGRAYIWPKAQIQRGPVPVPEVLV